MLVKDLIERHPTNVIHNPQYLSATDKEWAKDYKEISHKYFRIHTTIEESSVVSANFDQILLPLDADDELRLGENAECPNNRVWRLEVEADIEHWWHAEISDVVLAAWARYPAVTQTSHTKPLVEASIAENIDSTYAIYFGGMRVAMVVGEIKRNLINRKEWQAGRLQTAQQKLARELRGYSYKYQCPQVFCFDGETLLLLQFRALKVHDIREADCPVDCWVIPAWDTCTLRYALYRLMVQGFRRCQGASAKPVTVGSYTEHKREFFSGRPVWKVDGKNLVNHPEGYTRMGDAMTGALKWVNGVDEIWETGAFWV